jgi:uncharacterized protein YggE
MNGRPLPVRSRTIRDWMLVAALGGLAVGLIAGPVAATVLAPTPTTVVPGADLPPEHTIAVTGSGTVVVVPDQATVRLGVLIERKTAKEARDAAGEAMTRVVAALRALNIAERDIATSAVSLGPVYDYKPDTAAKIRGYQLVNVVTVTVRDLDRLSDVVDNAVTAGATTVEGITFEVADRAAAEADAREAAVKDAKAKAETLARGVGARISGVASMSESVTTPAWYGRSYQAGAVADSSTPILPGSTDVVINVSVTFLID